MLKDLEKDDTSISMAFIRNYNDILIEILLHLPVQSLLRFRSVCKFWRELIDSPYFRNLHNHQHKIDIEEDEKLYLQLDHKLSIKFLHNPLTLHHVDQRFLDPRIDKYISTVAGPSKGLICINYNFHPDIVPIVICNPFLRLTKIFPISFSLLPGHQSSGKIGIRRYVAIGFDDHDVVTHDQYYKVVQLLTSVHHRPFHVRLYSRATDSWRDLAGLDDQTLCIKGSVKSLCRNDYFAHWIAIRNTGEGLIIVTFDMRKEVFWTVVVPDHVTRVPVRRVKIFANPKNDDDAYSFLLFVLPDHDHPIKIRKSVEVYESRRSSEGEVGWDLVMKVDDVRSFCGLLPELMSMWRSHCCVVLKNLSRTMELVFYDYRARKFIGYCKSNSRSNWPYLLKVFQYQGSFVAP